MPQASSRRRRWPLILAALAVVLAGAWAGLWHYAAGITERTVAGWKAREARSGRIYTCANQTVSGFPFRIEVRCADAAAELKSNQPPLAVKTKDLVVTASVWQPTVLTSEFVGPLTVAEPGAAADMAATWRSAQTQVRGLPTSPERVSIVLEAPVLDRLPGGPNLFKATRLELNGRLVSGTVKDNPVIEIALMLAAATAPRWHPAAAVPVDADITAVLHGLKDFSPKPWPARFRELQAAGGRIQITHARVRQGETIAIANGVLGLSPRGRLDGQVRLTVAHLPELLARLGLDRMLAQQTAPQGRLGSALSALDRISPALGSLARQNAAPAMVAGLNFLGEPAELEGQRAVTLPLRVSDGLVSLGPLAIGRTPALY
jgi:hypothetical protein